MNLDHQLSSYDYKLPESHIAHRPMVPRDHSKLLVYNKQNDEKCDDQFFNLPKYLPKNALLVFNQVKVVPARLLAKKEHTGGKVEIFFSNLAPCGKKGEYCVLLKSNGKKGTHFSLIAPQNVRFTIKEKYSDGSYLLQTDFQHGELIDYLADEGHVPIPPYIRQGEDDDMDKSDYQTIFAKNSGAVAASTASFHFTPQLMENLKKNKIKTAFVTLYVGAGTFLPVKKENILDHNMHSEYFFVDSKNAQVINDHKLNDRPIIAVGTTALRVLETSYDIKYKQFRFPVQTQLQSTNIFIYPGIEVNSIQGMITNFHLPKSSLMMLVSALLGRLKLLNLYEYAIREDYRFFSYGDGMLILL